MVLESKVFRNFQPQHPFMHVIDIRANAVTIGKGAKIIGKSRRYLVNFAALDQDLVEAEGKK